MYDKTIINTVWGDDGCCVAGCDSPTCFFAIPLSGSLWWRDFLCFPPSLFLTRAIRLAIIGSCLKIGIDHLDRPSIPPILLHPSLSPSFSLPPSSSSPPPYFFQAVSPSHLAAATLISMLDGVPSSVQTNSWINRRVQTLSSLFPAQMVENSNATRWKPRGGEAETERERWQGWSGWRTSEMILLTFFFLLLCYSMISGKIMKDELHTASHNTSEKEGKVNGI